MGNERKGRALQRKKKRNFLGNQYLSPKAATVDGSSSSDRRDRSPSPSLRCGASERKLRDIPSLFDTSDSCSSDLSSSDGEKTPSCSDSDSFADDDEFLWCDVSADAGQVCGNGLPNLESLQEIFSDVSVWKFCGTGQLCITKSGRAGLAPFLSITCSDCHHRSVHSLVKKSAHSRFFDVNRRSVLAMRRIGKGHKALKKFCGVMDMPGPVAKANFNRHQKALRGAALTVAESSMHALSKHSYAVVPNMFICRYWSQCVIQIRQVGI